MPNAIDIHVGSRIRQRRALAGMSLMELAERVGISYQQMQKYETGDNRVSASRLWHIAHLLDVPVSYFFEGLEGRSSMAGPTRGDILTDKEALKLVSAYSQLPKPQRERLLELVCAFSRAA